MDSVGKGSNQPLNLHAALRIIPLFGGNERSHTAPVGSVFTKMQYFLLDRQVMP